MNHSASLWIKLSSSNKVVKNSSTYTEHINESLTVIQGFLMHIILNILHNEQRYF